MKLVDRYYKWILLLIPVLSLCMHFHVFHLDLLGYHVWRQSQTQTVINNFYRGDFNILNPCVNNYDLGQNGLFRMEFPIMQWLFALCYKVFGASVALSRVLTFLLGLCSVWGMFHLADAVFKNKTAATIAAWAFNWSPVFYYYTVNPLPDNCALCCCIWSMVFFIRYIAVRRFSLLVWSAVFLSLATLAKLPFVLTGGAIAGYAIILLKERRMRELAKIIVVFTVLLLPAVIWYALVIPHWEGNGVAKGVFIGSPEWGKLLYFAGGVLTSMLPELLVNYGSVLFFIAGFWFLGKRHEVRKRLFPVFGLWSVAAIAYYLFEINMIELVHDYYLFPFLPLIFLVVPYGAVALLQNRHKWLRIVSIVALVMLPFTAFLRADTRWDEQEPGVNKALYDHKDELRKLIPADAKCIAGSDDSRFIMLYYIDRKGWNFSRDELDGAVLDRLMAKGATYLFSDSRADEHADVQQRVKRKVFEAGTLRVYELNTSR